MSQVVSLPLTVDLPLDKPRRFKFTPFECTRACRVLNTLGYQVFQQPVNSGTLLTLLGSDSGFNLDVWSAVIHAGLIDTKDQKTRSHEDVMRLLSDYIADGKSLEPLALAIREAGMRSHIWREREQDDDGANKSAEGNDGSGSRDS